MVFPKATLKITSLGLFRNIDLVGTLSEIKLNKQLGNYG